MRLAAVAIAGALLLGSCSSDQTTRDDSGEIVEGGELGVFAVQEGDCVNFPTSDSDGVGSFDAVACDEPHDGEIYELFDITGFDDFPGDDVVGELGDEGCLSAFESFIGLDFQQSIYFIQRLRPTQDTWDDLDDREVICIVVPPEGDPPLTMSLEGIAQ